MQHSHYPRFGIQSSRNPRAWARFTDKGADRFKFEVPPPRNVEMTYPYFHDGEAEKDPERGG